MNNATYAVDNASMCPGIPNTQIFAPPPPKGVRKAGTGRRAHTAQALSTVGAKQGVGGTSPSKMQPQARGGGGSNTTRPMRVSTSARDFSSRTRVAVNSSREEARVRPKTTREQSRAPMRSVPSAWRVQGTKKFGVVEKDRITPYRSSSKRQTARQWVPRSTRSENMSKGFAAYPPKGSREGIEAITGGGRAEEIATGHWGEVSREHH